MKARAESDSSEQIRSGGRRTLTRLILLGIANHAVLSGSRVTVSLAALDKGATPLTVGVLNRVTELADKKAKEVMEQ